MDVKKSHITNLEVLEVTWCQVSRRGRQRPPDQRNQSAASGTHSSSANVGIVPQGGR